MEREYKISLEKIQKPEPLSAKQKTQPIQEGRVLWSPKGAFGKLEEDEKYVPETHPFKKTGITW